MEFELWVVTYIVTIDDVCTQYDVRWKREEASLEDELEMKCDQVGKMTLKVEKY